MKIKNLLFIVLLFSNNSFSSTACENERLGFQNASALCMSSGYTSNEVVPHHAGGVKFVCWNPNNKNSTYTTMAYASLECFSGLFFQSTRNAPQNPRPQCYSGSIIQASNQVVGEAIPLVGINFSLMYFSNKVIARKADYKSNIKVASAYVASTVTGYSLEIKDENNTTIYNNTFSPTPNLEYIYEWNGLDTNLTETWGPAKKTISIHEDATDLNLPNNTYSMFLGNLKAKKLGLGGWVPSIWHFYHAPSGTLYMGDGNFRKVTGVADGSYTRISSENGKEVYYFDSIGKIVFTKLGITGTTIYSFTYDSAQRLSTITEPFSKVTTFNRSTTGVLQNITAPNGKVTDVNINTHGYLTQTTNPIGEIYSMTYYGSTGGLLNTFTTPNGNVTTFVFDSEGNLLSDSHSNGFSVTLAKTSTGVTNTSALGRLTTIAFNSNTGIETTTRPSGYNDLIENNSSYIQRTNSDLYETINYQAHPRFGGQARRMSSISSYNYGQRASTFSNSTVLSDPTNPFSIDSIIDTETIGSSSNTSTYDGVTRTVTFNSALGKTSLLQIDQYQRPILTQIGNITARAFTYTNDLLTSITEGVRTNTLAYNTLGLLQSVTNSLNETTSFSYDSAQRLKTTTFPDSRIITFNYDSNGNLTSLTPPLRSNLTLSGLTPHSLVFGTKGKLTSYNPPTLSGVTNVNTVYSYNNDKQLTQITRPDGKIINLNYNSTSGLLSTISGTFGTITNYYTDEKPSYIEGLYSDSLSIGYNRNTPVSFNYTRNGDSIYIYSRSAYSPIGGKTGNETLYGRGSGSVDRTINYSYDEDEYLTSAGDLTLNYNSLNGQLTGTALGSITDLYTYNNFGEVATYEAKYNTTSLYRYVLTRDAVGRVSQKVETLNGVVNTFVYTYDSAGRLAQVNTNGSVTATYSYDENSNRSGGIIGGATTSATYDKQDRLTSYNGTALTYNDNGEILSKGTASFTYDYFGNLKTYVNGATNINYEIDPNQRRIGRVLNSTLTDRYIYNPEGRLVGLLNGTNKLVKAFVYGSKSHVPDYFIDSTGSKFRIITDYLGSVRLVVSSTGAILQRMEHDEFGQVMQDTSVGYTPFGFAGGLYDSSSGLLRYGARDYDPSVGRWASKDPIGFVGGDTNLYGYVLQDPINLIDPSGNCPWCIGAGIGAVIGGASGYYTTGTLQGALIGAGSGALSGTTLGSGFLAGMLLGGTTNIATQLTGGTSISNLNYTGAGLASLAGGLGAGTGILASKFFQIPFNVIGRPLGSTAKLSDSIMSSIVGGVAGSGLDSIFTNNSCTAK